MKNLFKSMMLVAVAAMGFTACSKDVAEEVNPEVQTITRELIVSAEKPALEGDTRTEFNGETVVWSTGDAIRMVYHSENGWGAKFYASKNAVIEGNKASFAVNTEFSANDGGNYQFYAGYPTKQWNGGDPDYLNEGTVSVEIPTEQTMPSANTFDSKGDLLIGKSVATYATIPAKDESMNFNYTRLVSHACVTLKNFAAVEGEKVLNVTFTAPAEVYLTGSSTADFEAQALTEDFDNNTVIVTMPENTAAKEDVVVWFCSAPATIAKDQTLTVTVETNLATYTRTIAAREGGIQFPQNNYSTLGINMASAEKVDKEIDSNDYSGDYYILAKRTTGNFWYATDDLGTASTKRYQAVETDSEDINSVDLTSATVWTIEATGEGTYYLKAGDQYAYWTSGNSGNFTETVGSAIKFTIEAGSEEGTYNIHWTASDAERYFALNESSGNNYFAFYKDTQIINLYLVPAAEDTTPRITAETEVSLTAEECEGTVTITTKNVTGEVTATQGDDYDWFAAEIDEDGNLFYFAEANTATESRTATVTLSAEGAADVVITFTQAAQLPGTGEGTEASPYDVTRALAAIDAYGTIDNAYVKGTITQIDQVSTEYGNATYYIDNDLQVYRGLYLGNVKFTAEDQIHVGDEVVVCGELKLYNTTYEFNTGSYIVSLTCNNGEGGEEPDPGTGDEPSGNVYTKITSTSELTDGQYLIVYEDELFAFDGSLPTLDVTNNYKSVTISDNKIAVTTEMEAIEFTIGDNKTTIKSKSGNYIGRTADINELDESSATAYTNTITINNDGTAHIVGSGGAVLRFNTTSGQDRFRYYKSSTYEDQKAITLYKKN